MTWQTSCGVADNEIDFSVIEAAFHELMDQKQSSAVDLHGVDSRHDEVMRPFPQIPRTQHCTVEPTTAPVARNTQIAPQASEQVLVPHELVYADNQDADEEVLNHFVDFDKNFLLDILGTLEGFGVDVGNLEQVASFDIQKLCAKFGRNFDLVKEWQRKIREVWE